MSVRASINALHRRRTTRRSNGMATRKRILETAAALFSTAGYEATSLRQIASAAEIDIATLKYHFGDKTALFAEVYRLGHEALLGYLQPCLGSLSQSQTKEQLTTAVRELVRSLHDFLEHHFAFVRMVLYRLLEGSEAIIDLEEELQGVATEMFDEVCEHLHRRGLTRALDHRAFINLLISAFTTWFVIAEVKPRWIQGPSPLSPEGRPRSEAFFFDLMSRLLLD